jgi:hypothetical protein
MRKCDEWHVDITAANASFLTVSKEQIREYHTDNDDCELESEEGFGQVTAQLLDALRRGRIRSEGDSKQSRHWTDPRQYSGRHG